MAVVTQASNLIEKVLGHGDNAVTEQDMTNPARNREKYADPSGEKMKALVWNGKNSVEVAEVPKPRAFEDRDVILKVTGSTICGSDLHLYHGTVVQMQKGDILGHEFCGKVESMGSAVKGLSVGDRVVASFQIACGDCMYCKKKLSSQCERTNSNTMEYGMYGGNTAGMFGYSHFTGGFAGGQAEYVRVPFGDVNLLKIPSDVPDEKALYLSDVLATSYNCVVDTGVKEGDVVAIWGAGPIGVMCAEYSFTQGASRVIMIDGGAASWRLDFCKENFSDKNIDTLNFTSLPEGCKNVTEALKKMEHGGPDVALECAAGEYAKGWAHYFELMSGAETDTSELVNEMITSVKNFGRCGITGVYVGFTNHFNIGSLMERGIRLIGNGQAPVHLYWEKLLQMIKEGKTDPYRMLTHRVDISEMDTLYQKFDQRADNIQKVFVQTRFSDEPAQGSPGLTSWK